MKSTVTIYPSDSSLPQTVEVPSGTLLTEAILQAGLKVGQPCGGQGRCGRCAVQVISGQVHCRSNLRLSEEDIAHGYVLACQSVVEQDVTFRLNDSEKIERKLTTNRDVREVAVPEGYSFERSQPIQRYAVTLPPPSLDDQADDWWRLCTALAAQHGLSKCSCSLRFLRCLGQVLREGNWEATVVAEKTAEGAHLIDIRPGLSSAVAPLWACAVDIGTTTVSLWLVDLVTGQVQAQVAEYNGQIARGEDVISRIVYAGKYGGGELQVLVVETINKLCANACKQVNAAAADVVKATIAGNTTMLHLLLGIPADSIRLLPFIPAVNLPPTVTASELGLSFCPDAVIDCLPGVASYVGADITAGVLAIGQASSDETTLFIDVGTNGEIVLGNRDWLMTCACSAGPAFEGAGVKDGMRATAGAIEEVWIDGKTYEPTFRVIGGGKPQGICGSALISLLAELFITGVLDKSGHFNFTLPSRRVRHTEQNGEYVLVWGGESADGEDIVLTRVDIDNLLRAKAAIYAGFEVLAKKVGFQIENVQRMVVGGSFGKFINIEKAIQIGLLPDLPWERFQFLGNTSIQGTYLALLSERNRTLLQQIAGSMTYIELSADNMFYEAFTSALFLPHTDLSKFPTVKQDLQVSALKSSTSDLQEKISAGQTTHLNAPLTQEGRTSCSS